MVETLYRADTEALETAWQAAAEAAGIGQAVQAAIDAAQPISGPRVARKRRRIAARARRAWLETPAGRAVAAEIEARRDEIQTAWQAEQDAKAAAEAAARRATPAARRRADLLRAAPAGPRPPRAGNGGKASGPARRPPPDGGRTCSAQLAWLAASAAR